MPRGPLVTLFLTVLVDLIGFGMVMPLLPFYATQFQATAGEVGMLVAIFSGFQFLFAPFWGKLSDQMGRRPILMFSLAVTSMAYCTLAFAKTLASVFVARALAGVGAANIPTAQAYVADVTSPQDRAKGMGMIGVAFGLGFVLGPCVGAGLCALGQCYDPNLALVVPALGASFLSTLALGIAFFCLPEPARREQDADVLASAPTGNTLLRLAITVFVLTTLAFAAVEATMPLWLKESFHYTGKDIGFLFAFMGVVVVLVQGGAVRTLSRRLGDSRMVVLGCLCMATGLLWLPFVTTLAGLMAVLALLALGQGTNHPGLVSLISRLGGSNQRGGRLGRAQSWSALARIVGPAAAGQLYSWPGPKTPYLAGSAGMALAAALSILVMRGCRNLREVA